jgi:hypothetical protein
MRVNVYAEELKNEVVITSKEADTGNKFIGVRFMLESAPGLHYRDNDDDRSAVTFWIPGSKFKGYKIDEAIAIFQSAIDKLRLVAKE